MREEKNIMDYSIKVKQLRENMLITQCELAEMLGVSFATVNRWENNKCQPTIKAKRKLRDLLIKNNLGD